MIMVAAWQLSSGPISLAFLTPAIANAVNSGQPYFRLTLKDTILTWAGWERTLDIRVLGVRVLRPDGSLVGGVPEVSFSLSGRALVRGLVAPQSIALFGPRLRVWRSASGEFDVGFVDAGTESADFTRHLLDQLLAQPDSSNPMSYLARVEIVGADVTFEDKVSKKSWVAPSTTLSFNDTSVPRIRSPRRPRSSQTAIAWRMRSVANGYSARM